MGSATLPSFRAPLALFAVFSVLAALPAGAQSATEQLRLVELDGGELAESELRQGTRILVVWATWSPRCRNLAPRLRALASAWSSRAQVASVIFQEEPKKVREFLAEEDGPPVFLDTTGIFSKRYDIATLPSLLILRDGETVFRGKLPADPSPVIERALAR